MTSSIYIAQQGNEHGQQNPVVCSSLEQAKNDILIHLGSEPQIDFEDLQNELNRLDDTPDFEDVKVILDSGDWYKITPIKDNPYEVFMVKAEGVFKTLGITPKSDLENLEPSIYERLDQLLEEFKKLKQRMKYLTGDNHVFLWWYTYKDSDYEYVLRYFF